MHLPVEIERAFENGATILTANVRAARWLRREYALRQREAARRVWASPPIEDWDSWVLRLWQALSAGDVDAPLLLTSLQERSVWTRMQREDAKLLVSPEAMAALAEEAYAMLCAYEVHAERASAWGQTDAERFRQWAAAFDKECARQGWVSRARIEGLVAERVAASPLPEQIVLVGFDRLTPARKRLTAAIEARGAEVLVCAARRVEASPRLVKATDLRDEITTCAHWIRGLLEENPLFGSEAAARIGVIVPELGGVRSEIERTFRRVLMPETDDLFASPARMPFEFSLGQPLGEVPVIRAALLLLRWAAEPLSEEQLSWLVLSRYLSQSVELKAQDTGAEYLALGSFDAELRNSGSLSLEVSLRHVLWQMGRFPALADVRGRLESLQKMAAVNHVTEEERTPGRWVDLAQVLLGEAGWRAAGRRDEIDFQARARWERLLDEIALLDFDGRRVNYRDFLEMLEMQAAETIFAAESHGAPVQVMGALEASGQQFDAVWFLGADDQAWPARGRLHPLLPGDLQKRAGMPHSTSEDDWELARVVTDRIAAQGSEHRAQSAEHRAQDGAPVTGSSNITQGTVVFSYAERNKDGELRPSPLIAQVAPGAHWESSAKLLAQMDATAEAPEAVKLEEVRDASGTIAWPGEEIAGGAYYLARSGGVPVQGVCRETFERRGAESRRLGPVGDAARSSSARSDGTAMVSGARRDAHAGRFAGGDRGRPAGRDCWQSDR